MEIMEFFIDRKFWNIVLKKLSPRRQMDLKQLLTQKYIKKDYKWNADKGKLTSKTTNKGGFIKKDFVLRLFTDKNNSINSGFFAEFCFDNPIEEGVDMRQNELEEIERAMLQVLIEKGELMDKIQYKCEFLVEQFNLDENINLLEKGFVYLIRNEDIFKIGITDNLLRRFNQLKPDEVLNVVRCSNYETLEKELHKKFKDFRIPQTEYFRLNKNQIEQVNIEMIKGAEF